MPAIGNSSENIRQELNIVWDAGRGFALNVAWRAFRPRRGLPPGKRAPEIEDGLSANSGIFIASYSGQSANAPSVRTLTPSDMSKKSS
jgi:hypothetical protein